MALPVEGLCMLAHLMTDEHSDSPSYDEAEYGPMVTLRIRTLKGGLIKLPCRELHTLDSVKFRVSHLLGLEQEDIDLCYRGVAMWGKHAAYMVAEDELHVRLSQVRLLLSPGYALPTTTEVFWRTATVRDLKNKVVELFDIPLDKQRLKVALAVDYLTDDSALLLPLHGRLILIDDGPPQD
jgi:hypothetical protein